MEVLADGNGTIMNESSDNLIVPKRTWKKFGLKRKGSPDSPKRVDYGSRANFPVPPESVNVSRQSSRRSDVVSPEPSVFPEASIRQAKSSSSDEEDDDESKTLCYKSSKINKIFLSVFNFLVGKVLRVAVVLTTLIIPFVMIIVGSAYWSECPREWRVPLFLVLGGSAAVSSNLVNSAQYLYEKRKESRSSVDMNRSTTSSVGGESEDELRTTAHFTDHCRNKLPCQMIGLCTSLIHTFAVGFFFAGCVWVYGAYDFSSQKYVPNYNNRSNLTLNSNFCNPRLYSFAFWILNLCFSLIFFSFFVGLTHYVVTSVREKKSTA